MAKATVSMFPVLAQGGTVDPFSIRKPFVKAYANTNKIIKNYAITIHDVWLKGAFTSGEIGLFSRVLTQQLNGISTGREAFRFEQTKEILSRYIASVASDAELTIPVSAITDQASMIAFITKVKQIMVDMGFWRTIYNSAGVKHQVSPNRLRLLIRADIGTSISTQLSTIFHQENLNFDVAQIVFVDNFGGIQAWTVPASGGTAQQLYPIYDPVTGAHTRDMTTGAYQWTETAGSTTAYTGDVTYKDTNANVLAMLIEEDFLVIAEQTLEMDFQRNARGKYTNYFLTDGAVYGYIPFSNAVVFATS